MNNSEDKRVAAATREILRESLFKAKKSLGQNFLVDAHVLRKIISAADIKPDELVIEVGPGIGGLTQELAERAGYVTAIEIDSSLIPILARTLAGYGNVGIINADILKTNIKELIDASGYASAKLVANLPYYITTPIIMRLLESRVPLSSIIVMVQKEVAGRICGQPGTKDYGALTLAAAFYADTRLIANVPQNSFVPRPNVDSAVIELKPRYKPRVKPIDEALMFEIIKAAFSMRRKTFINCLHNTGFAEISKSELAQVFASLDLDANVRGEDLTLEQYANLSDALSKMLCKNPKYSAT